MSDTPIDYFEDLPAPAVNLKDITDLAALGAEKQAELDAKTLELEVLQQEVDKIYRRQLPELMRAAAMDEFKLEDGSKLARKSDIKTSISVANAPSAYRWLEDHEYDGIIKTKVVSEFGRGEIEEAKKVVELLMEQGVMADLNRAIHPATLKSFVKERLEAGEAIPMDVFGVYEFEIVKVTKPRASAKKK
ncbi:hypothetical protein Gekk315_00005 [Aeromonas phage Gekk3-15]